MLKASVQDARLNGGGPLGIAPTSAGERRLGRRMVVLPAGESKLGVVEGPNEGRVEGRGRGSFGGRRAL